MDWTNERYVRLYTRDTTTWRLLSWEAQAVLPQLLRIVDRAGVLDTAGATAVEAVAAALQRWPIYVVEEAMESLRTRGVIEILADAVVVPKFLEAQEATSSQAQRQRDSREKRRAEARAGVTPGHDATRPVTERDEGSRTVTAGHAESLQPSYATPFLPNRPDAAAATAIAPPLDVPLQDGRDPRGSTCHPTSGEMLAYAGTDLLRPAPDDPIRDDPEVRGLGMLLPRPDDKPANPMTADTAMQVLFEDRQLFWADLSEADRPKLTTLSRQPQSFDGLGDALFDHGWDLVRKVHDQSMRASLTPSLKSKLYACMFWKGGFGVRLEAFNEHTEAAANEAKREAARIESDPEIPDDSPDITDNHERIGEMLAGADFMRRGTTT